MVIFGKFTNHRTKKRISKLLKFNVVKELNYLGVKMTLRRIVSSDFSRLMEVAANRLNIWGQKFISLEGKMVLIKSAFLSLPMFLTSISLVPLSILNEFDKMCRSFLLKKNNGNTGIPYTSWKKLCKTKKKEVEDYSL
ncbi:Putative ribonuclease H protein [Dendrobium catenatum]|uniref:Ribonuclease H protein n=1 Tax=Dendrobium catenatum TaxID=906689 RepID=A0A2I0VPD7_9ASPA|nr:Putative ribonuclease H protein [Dendrobium catenatum]